MGGILAAIIACGSGGGGGGGSYGSVVNPIADIVLNSLGDWSSGLPGQASIEFHSDGWIVAGATYLSSSKTYLTEPNAWNLPKGGNPGAAYYIRLQVTSGVAPDSGAVNTAESLALARSWVWYDTVTPGTRTSAGVIQIATDPAFTNIVSTANYSLTVQVQT